MCVHFSRRDDFTKVEDSNLNTSMGQNYLWLDLVGNREDTMHINRSVASTGRSLYEQYSYNSSFISIVTHDYFYWTMQFSYYMQVTFENVGNNGYVRVRNSSEVHMMSTNQSTIHYINAYSSGFHHGIMFSAISLFSKATRYHYVQSYVTLTQGQKCPTNAKKFLVVIDSRHFFSKTLQSFYIDNIIVFEESFLYFMTMFHNFGIDLKNLPSCEVVLSYRMIIRRIRHKTQKNCTNGYFNVSRTNSRWIFKFYVISTTVPLSVIVRQPGVQS